MEIPIPIKVAIQGLLIFLFSYLILNLAAVEEQEQDNILYHFSFFPQ